jgi:hypothetical protein
VKQALPRSAADATSRSAGWPAGAPGQGGARVAGHGRHAPSPARLCLDEIIERQLEASVSARLAAAALARRHERRNRSEQALRDAGVPLDQTDWAR